MKAPTVFTTPNGDEMVLLSRAAFDLLVATSEEGRDVLAYDLAKEALESGEEERLPAEMVSRLVGGEHPVRIWRQHRGLSIAALASRVGLSEGYVSQIETGKRDGTIDAFKRFAEALRVSVDDLV